MTPLSSTAITVGALSLGVVTLFKVFTPDVPLSAAETELVVGTCAVVVVSVRWVLRKLTRPEVQP